MGYNDNEGLRALFSPVSVSSGVLCVDVSAEAELLVAGYDDGVVAVWSLTDQQLIHALQGHTGECDGDTRWFITCQCR